MARQRDYRAEYQRRQARSQARYGTSYNEYRRLQSEAKKAGIPADTFRQQAFIEGTVNGNLNRIKRSYGTNGKPGENTVISRPEVSPTRPGEDGCGTGTTSGETRSRTTDGSGTTEYVQSAEWPYETLNRLDWSDIYE